MTQPSPLQQAAIAYIRQGFAVTPATSLAMLATPARWQALQQSPNPLDRFCWYLVREGILGKSPIPVRWHNYTTREEEALALFARYPLAAISVATGQPSGIAVLDIDHYRKAHHRLNEITLPETRRVITGRGEHHYFRFPEARPFTKLNFHGNMLLGNGTHASLPETLHANGKTYRWENEHAPLAPLPPELLNAPSFWVSSLFFFSLYKYVLIRLQYHVAVPLLRSYLRWRFP